MTEQNPSPENQKKAKEAKELLRGLNFFLVLLFPLTFAIVAAQLPLWTKGRPGEVTIVVSIITFIAYLLTLPLRSKWRRTVEQFTAPMPLLSITEKCSVLLNDKRGQVNITAIYQIPETQHSPLNKERISVDFLASAAKYFERCDASYKLEPFEAHLRTALSPVIAELGIPVFRLNVIEIQPPIPTIPTTLHSHDNIIGEKE